MARQTIDPARYQWRMPNPAAAIDAWFDDLKLSSQSMPQAFVPRTTASLLTSVFEQAWRWLQAQFASWFGQPAAASLLSEPPAGQV